MILYEMFDHDESLTIVDALRDFLPLAMNHLQIEKLPRIHIRAGLKTGSQPSFGQFGTNNEINVEVEGRHPVDVLRTLAHELTHFAQNLRNEIEDNSGETGSDIENQANAEAGVIMRNFNKKYPKYLSLRPIILRKS
jgi:uncharacterized protein YvpB